MLHVRFWRILAITAAIVIVSLSLIPEPPEIRTSFHFADKIAHFIAYLVLSFLVFASISGEKGEDKAMSGVFIVSALCLFYGGLIEILQTFTGREADLWDLLADLIGAVCGALVGLGFRKFVGRKQTSPPR